MKRILLLGGSGSIGSQSIQVIDKYKSNFNLVGISIGERTEKLDEIIKNHANLKYITLKLEKDYDFFKQKYPTITFYYGDIGLIEIIKNSNSDMVINALIGFVGFLPSIETIKNNKTLLLANKETLVAGGEIINSLLKEYKTKMYPIDSEHVAISKCLFNRNSEVKKIIITASGGPFFFLPKKDFAKIKPEDALKHPTWKMGNKITIDSATMMNKCFEIIEAHELFHLDFDRIDVLVDRKSHVHSMVEYENGDIFLQVGPSDMRIPIEYALFEGKPIKGDKFDDVEVNTFNNYQFYKMEYEKFPLIKYAQDVIKQKGNLGAILNAANEVCVNSFLSNKINYVDIKRIIDKIMKVYPYIKDITISDILKTDKEVRELTQRIIEEKDYD